MTTDNINQNIEQPKKNKKIKKTMNTSTIQKPPKESEQQKITIELYKYKTLIEALGDRGRVRRVVITIFFLGILLFAGISAITVAIKRLYPYSDITTNGLGATTIKSEKNEVSYWLFNTAILWANSGIHVDKGDIITIRASGKSHTAIHHLLDDAAKNKEKHSNWVGSEGEIDESANERDKIRRKFRIFPDAPSGALLMQVVQNDKCVDTPEEGDPNNFYFIGKERQHIYINSNGTLHFAVNDIVLNRSTIANMMWENIRSEYNDNDSIDDQTKKLVNDYLKQTKKPKDISEHKVLHLKEKDSIEWKDSIKRLFEDVFKKEIDKANQNWTGTNTIGKMELGYTLKDRTHICELSYYYGIDSTENASRKKVWFEDNIGSFLIVIEKTK